MKNPKQQAPSPDRTLATSTATRQQTTPTALTDIDLLIFDLDGTLVDSRHDLADAVNYALEQMGKIPLAYEQIPPLLGSGIGKLLEDATGTDDAAELIQARRFFDEYYGDFFARKTVCYPDVQETLEYFSSKRKAIYSNKFQAYTEGIARQLGIYPLFDIVQGANPGLYPLKPHPKGLQLILERLEIPAERALMIGDSTHDLEAAKAAGIRTCAVTYGYRSLEELLACEPDFTIPRLKDLVVLVEK